MCALTWQGVGQMDEPVKIAAETCEMLFMGRQHTLKKETSIPNSMRAKQRSEIPFCPMSGQPD